MPTKSSPQHLSWACADSLRTSCCALPTDSCLLPGVDTLGMNCPLRVVRERNSWILQYIVLVIGSHPTNVHYQSLLTPIRCHSTKLCCICRTSILRSYTRIPSGAKYSSDLDRLRCNRHRSTRSVPGGCRDQYILVRDFDLELRWNGDS